MGFIRPEPLSKLALGLQNLSLNRTLKKEDSRGFYPTTLADFSVTGTDFRAGVMPYYEENGEKYVLLGREINSKTKEWDFFAGGSEKSLLDPLAQEDPLDAATREFYEEACVPKTLGWDTAQVKDYIANNTTNVVALYGRNVASHRPAVVYFVKFSKADILKIMKNLQSCFADKKMSHSFKEKDALVVVKLKDLITATKNYKSTLKLDKKLPYWSLKGDKQDAILFSGMLDTFLHAWYTPEARYGKHGTYRYIQDEVSNKMYIFFAQELIK